MSSKSSSHPCSIEVICNLYPEVNLHSRINNRAIMLAQLACRSQPGIYLALKEKYRTRNEGGMLKNLDRQIAKTLRDAE